MKLNSLSKFIIFLFLVIPFSLFISSIWLKKHQAANTYLTQGSLLPKAQALPQFNLTDMNGAPFVNQNLKGQWSLLFFGFTRCPDVCPTSLAQLAHAQQLFAKEINPQIVFISIDPEHDSLKRIKIYLQHINSHFVGVTGKASELGNLTRALGVSYEKITTTPSYTFTHSNLILVINPKGEWVAVLTPPHEAKDIANDLSIIQKVS